MKILFIARSTLYSQPGGDTLQVEQTAKYLRKNGGDVSIFLSHENPNPKNYDLVHFFNLSRPADLMPYLFNIQKLVVSSIYVDYSEFDKNYRSSFYKFLYKIFGKFGVEYLKTIARFLKGKEKFPSWDYLFFGQKKSIEKIIKKTDFLITTSIQEKENILNDFDKIPPFKKINLGTEHFPVESFGGKKEGVICAARVEGLKNQLNLIRASKNQSWPLSLAGKAATHQFSYFEKCKKEAGKNVEFLGWLASNDLSKRLAVSKVHAMPSFYETTGLSTLEALKSSCQAVITDRGAQKEIFGDHVFYCEPSDPDSIKTAIQKAMQSDENHRAWVEENFSWEKAAREILDIYRELLSTK